MRVDTSNDVEAVPIQPTTLGMTGGLQYTCNYCKISFKSYSLMRAHTCVGHGKKDEVKRTMPAPTVTSEQLKNREGMKDEILINHFEEKSYRTKSEKVVNFAEVTIGNNDSNGIETMKDIL